MCSLGDEYYVDGDEASDMTPQAQVVLPLSVGNCRKCEQDGEMYKLDFREAECKSCFLQYVNHKFRATLGSSKCLPRNADILLLFDGSAQSIVLLDMLHSAHSESSFKRLHCDFKILFIDDYEFTIRSQNTLDYISYIRKVQAHILSYKSLKCYVINLRCDKNQAPFEITNIESYLTRDTDKEKTFENNFYGVRTPTSRKEYLKVHRNKLIASMALYLNSKYVFSPSISINIATDLLSAIVLGGGNNAALDVALLDDRLGNGVKFIRPIRDLGESEILLYMRARNLKTLKTPLVSETTGNGSSLQGVTELFIQNLKKNYTSTVSTIFRTGSKITTINYSTPEGPIQAIDSEKNEIGLCRFCNSLISIESQTLLAVDYSRYVSEEATSPMNLLYDSKSKRKERLCHSCRNIQRDCDINLVSPC